LPEVTTVRPGQPVEVPLEFRNLAACEVKVYRIDLMKFALLRQNLAGIAQVNLAGIEPQHTAAVRLGDGRDYRDRTQPIKLDLRDEGAYLVVCRGDDLFASGLLLITPLELQVQHDAVAQEVRATVKDAVADRFLHDVQVKVCGSGTAEFMSGQTDRRGLFAAQGVAGTPTVIAQAAPGRYAFYRGRAVVEAGSLPPEIAARIEAAERSLATQAAVWQSPFSGPSKSAGIILSGPWASPAVQRIAAVLDAPTSVAFEDAPLQDVVKLLARQHGISVVIDKKALDDIGVGTDMPVTFNARGIALRSALRTVLRDLGLTYLIRDESLTITTPEEAEGELVTVAYPVTDLVRLRDAQGQAWSDFDTFINTITSTIAPVSWDTVGGPGAIDGATYRNTDVLVVSQTQDVHREVAALLDKLRVLAADQSADGEPPVRERPAGAAGQPNGFGGGMGGFFGGAPAGAGQPKSAAGSADLLQGLQDTYRHLQATQVEQLKRMYHQGMGGGMGGVSAGGFF
jgi:hypothetical protein